MKRRQMATPSRAKSGSRPASSGRMAKAGGAVPFDPRRGLFSLMLWGLGIVNLLLIASSIRNHFSTGNEHAISSEAPVVTVPDAALKIEVLNGCGVDGLARKVADYLKKQGFDPVNITNFERSDIPRTMIIDRISNSSENGRKLARVLGLSDDYVSYLSSPERMVAVSVIIGQDHKILQISPK
ncbi:MAG: LytR C-terminal domain-containing protein [candidate division KSB1 bacterium]|nr:LytR C-terminal domain-containing protein [candidate division KSB1 bacterium]MDZ7304580.1 LytR C-terminal domain-containing protein [candidate division KSB1 bacterium]MDZ7313625.1 LytR C-terminal domain-containing protein [candidate division KSB1 bacterium]